MGANGSGRNRFGGNANDNEYNTDSFPGGTSHHGISKQLMSLASRSVSITRRI